MMTFRFALSNFALSQFAPCQFAAMVTLSGSRDSMLLRAPVSWSKGYEFESRQERRENCLLQSSLCVLTLIRCPSHLTAVSRKRSRSFRQKCRWQVTPKDAHTLDPTKSEWADYAAVRAECGNLSGNELTRNPSGNIRPQLSQLSSLSHCGLIMA